MKKRAFCFLMCLCCLQLWGCTAFPNYSEEDTKLISEYAAGLLIQHSELGANRLTDVEETSYVAEETKDGGEENTQDDPEKLKEPSIQPSKEDDGDELSVSDAKEETVEETTYPLNVLLGMDLLNVQCTGYEVQTSYAGSDDMSLDAKNGNQLVILKFALTNLTEDTIKLNQLEKDITYRVSLNGTGYKQALSTLLLNDLSTYTGSIKKGETIELVLLSEWSGDETRGMEGITLHIRNGEMSGICQVE